MLKLTQLRVVLIVGLLNLIGSPHTVASELVHEFKNPSFSGQGYSNHVLSIEQLQFQRKKEAQEKADADAAKAKREAESTTLAKFLNNVESRIYAQLSKQLVDNMFTEDGSDSGTATIEGASIYWIKDATSDTITVQITEDDGTFTEIVVPLSGFGF
jgi:Na+-transporting NADH:ubiquinone oxidoreductase subunit NqrC